MATQTRSRLSKIVTVSSLLLIVGGIVIVAGVGLRLYAILRPAPPDPGLVEQFVVERERMPTPVLASTTTPEPIPASPFVVAPTTEPTPTPEPEPYVIEGIRFAEGAPIELRFHIPESPVSPDKVIEIPQFTVYDWHPDIFINPDFFQPGDHTAVSYIDDGGRVALWAHSGGRQTTMYPIQHWLEANLLKDLDASLESSFRASAILIGSDVDIIVAGQYTGSMRVAAAVRVAPLEVPEMISHVGDLIPYLAATYPNADFQSVVNRQQVVYLYFCGLALDGEPINPEANKWTQARFVIALVSAWETATPERVN